MMNDEENPRVPEDPPQEYDRRRGPRRGQSDHTVPDERRRSADRRNVPGFGALIDTILGVRRVKPVEEPKENGDEPGSG
jgi:hypothetical protein